VDTRRIARDCWTGRCRRRGSPPWSVGTSCRRSRSASAAGLPDGPDRCARRRCPGSSESSHADAAAAAIRPATTRSSGCSASGVPYAEVGVPPGACRRRTRSGPWAAGQVLGGRPAAGARTVGDLRPAPAETCLTGAGRSQGLPRCAGGRPAIPGARSARTAGTAAEQPVDHRRVADRHAVGSSHSPMIDRRPVRPQAFCGKPRFRPPWLGSSQRLVMTLPRVKKCTPSAPCAWVSPKRLFFHPPKE